MVVVVVFSLYILFKKRNNNYHNRPVEILLNLRYFCFWYKKRRSVYPKLQIQYIDVIWKLKIRLPVA